MVSHMIISPHDRCKVPRQVLAFMFLVACAQSSLEGTRTRHLTLGSGSSCCGGTERDGAKDGTQHALQVPVQRLTPALACSSFCSMGRQYLRRAVGQGVSQHWQGQGSTTISYAAVFPEPVLARMRMSFPSSNRGIAFSCRQDKTCHARPHQ